MMVAMEIHQWRWEKLTTSLDTLDESVGHTPVNTLQGVLRRIHSALLEPRRGAEEANLSCNC